MLSLDSVPVLFMTRRSITTNGSGRVAGLEPGELARLDAGLQARQGIRVRLCRLFEARRGSASSAKRQCGSSPREAFEAETGALVASLATLSGGEWRPCFSSFSETA